MIKLGDNMFKFTKAFVKVNPYERDPELQKLKEIEKISKIREQMSGNMNKQPNKPIANSNVSENIHRERVNALRNIKKD